MKTVFTARELMEVAMTCIANSLPPSDPEPTIHCLDCKKIVSADEAAINCYPANHQIIESKDEGAAA